MRRVHGVAIAVAASTSLAVVDVLAGTDVIVAGLIAVEPCLAATSGGRRAVLAVGVYVIFLILLVSWPDQMWWTRQQFLYLLAAVMVTAVSSVIAHRRAVLEEYSRVMQASELESRRNREEAQRIAAYSRSLIEASTDPQVTISAEGKITDVNTATEKVTGVRRDRLLGTEFQQYFTDPVLAKEGYHRVFADGVVSDYPLLRPEWKTGQRSRCTARRRDSRA